jgi:hypothetical protein
MTKSNLMVDTIGFSSSVVLSPNVLRICEVHIEETLKLNTNLNSVFHIYAVIQRLFLWN